MAVKHFKYRLLTFHNVIIVFADCQNGFLGHENVVIRKYAVYNEIYINGLIRKLR